MKKLLSIIFVFIILLSLNGCKQSSEKLLIGSWNSTNIEISKIDEISKLFHYYEVQNLEQQIEDYTLQLKTTEDSIKPVFEEIINNFNSQLSELTVEKVKDEIISNYKYNTFSFNEDSLFVIKSDTDSIVGRWTLNNKDQILKISIKSDDIYLNIKDISKNNLTVVLNSNIDTINFEITYTFEKQSL